MSYNDFLIISGLNNNSGTQYTGSSFLNSSLSNPLTSSVQCRVLNLNANGGGSITGNFLLSSSISGGMYVNIPETKSVSLRIWSRHAVDSDQQGVSLLAKSNGRNTALVGDEAFNHPDNYPNSRYEFGYESGNGGRIFYSFGGYRTNAQGPQYIKNVGFNKWVGIRMDIVPVKINKIISGTPVTTNFKDIISLYTASVDTPNNWVEIMSTELLATDNRYVPWGSYTCLPPVGFYTTPITTSSYGFSVKNVGNTSGWHTYFDDFQIYVKDAF